MPVGFEVEGGSAGKFVLSEIMHMLAGRNVRGMRPAADKVTRAGPVAALALAGGLDGLAWLQPWRMSFARADV